MASLSLAGGGFVPDPVIIPYPFDIGGIPGTGDPAPSSPLGGIVDIIKALGEAIGNILNPPSVTPLPPGAGVGSGGGVTVISQSTVLTIAIVAAGVYLIVKQ